MNVYNPNECAVFWKTKEHNGGLSNMCAGYPLIVNGHRFLTSEALYQACRFPFNPEIQELIQEQKSPMSAKMVTKPYRHLTRPDWEETARILVMYWCIGVKAKQHKSFGDLLKSTGNLQIVERSSKDDFWGTKLQNDGTLVGNNVLGIILMQWRDNVIANVYPKIDISDLLIFGEPVIQ